MNRVDEKGKVFTERIRKVSVLAEIVTVYGRLEGYLHPRPGERVKDLLNTAEEMFVAVTNATVFNNNAASASEIRFLAINKHHIISVVPLDEEADMQKNERWEY